MRLVVQNTPDGSDSTHDSPLIQRICWGGKESKILVEHHYLFFDAPTVDDDGNAHRDPVFLPCAKPIEKRIHPGILVEHAGCRTNGAVPFCLS
jgi:hypothetical protein